MAVYKRFNSKRVSSKHPAYSKARWWVYKRIKGQKTIHKVIPEARTREEAELAELQLVKALFDKAYGVTDTTTTDDRSPLKRSQPQPCFCSRCGDRFFRHIL